MIRKNLAQLYFEHTGKVSDKWSLYLSEYDRLLAPFRDSPVKLLEIGIQNGGSLEIWSKFFDNAERIIGCDINPNCQNLIYKNARITVVVGDANTDGTESEIAGLASGFDIVIDDGSHRSSDIIKSFSRYFQYVTDGGVFIAEDLHCSYWEEYEGGLFHPLSSIAFFKRLADVIAYEHWGVTRCRSEVIQSFFSEYSCSIEEEVLSQIHSIEFINSICVIRKKPSASNQLGRRIVTHGTAEVWAVVQQLNNTQMSAPSQTFNVWSQSEMLPEKVLVELREEITALHAATEKAVGREAQVARLVVDHLREEITTLHAATEKAVGREAQVARLVVDLQEEITTLHAATEEAASREAQVARLVVDLREEITTLHAATEEAASREAQVARLVADRDAQLASLKETIRIITHSRSWRFTRPLRWLNQQQRCLSEQGAVERLNTLVRKVVRVTARKTIIFVKARPTLKHWLQKLAARLGFAQSLRKLSHRLQQRPNDETTALSQSVAESYPAWVARFDTPSSQAQEQMASSGNALSPIVILATFDASSAKLAPALGLRLQESIGQPWTAIFQFLQGVDATQMTQEVRDATNSEPRIAFERTAVTPATDIFILIEGGALPRPHALRIFADALRSAPKCLLAYADEDRIADGSILADPWFKPEFSPLLSQQGMLLGRMLAIRDSDQQRLWASLCTTTDVADFARRYAQEAGPTRVIHIPHVLYHDALPPSQPITLNLELPNELPVVSIVIPTRDRWDLLGPCLKSLRLTTWPADRIEIVVIDNGSTDAETLNQLSTAQESGQIRVLKDDKEFNWSRLNNIAARDSRGSLFVFLNNDTELADPEWLKKLATHALQPQIGAVGCKLLYEDRTVQHGGVIAGIQGVAGHAHLFLQPGDGGYRNLAITTHEVCAVTGACLAVTRENFEAVGGFDENFRVAFNDVAFCFSLQKLGKRNIYVADPLFIHYESKSRGYDDTPEKLALQQTEARKAWSIHADLMRADPFYSPNLSLWSPYELAFAPRRRAAWDVHSSRAKKVMMLSVTHAVGHGVAVVLALQAEALARQGYAVLVAGPSTPNDFPYEGCERVEVHDAVSAATLAAIHGVDLIIAHTPPFFSVARWTGIYPPVIAYDYGEPPPDWFPDAAERRAILAEKDQSLLMASAVYAISDAVAAESRTPVNGVIPLGNAHLGQWTEGSRAKRDASRAHRGWEDKFVVLNVCRFHSGERRYKGVDMYADVRAEIKRRNLADSSKMVFVLCGKGSPEDVAAMAERGLTVVPNVTNEEMLDLYCAADAYANFSQWEGYNLGIGQALAMGLPTIASDIPAHRAFGIEVTSEVGSAADWMQRNVAKLPMRTPKVWTWEAPHSQLISLIESMIPVATIDESSPPNRGGLAKPSGQGK